MTSKTLSLIEPHEEDEAKRFIEQHLGFPAPDTPGDWLTVKIYVRPEEIVTWIDEATGQEKSIYMPPMVAANDKFKKASALVVSVGPDAYKAERYKESGPWCKPGDWIVIPRNEGTQINYRGIPMQVIPCHAVLWVIPDPTFVEE